MFPRPRELTDARGHLHYSETRVFRMRQGEGMLVVKTASAHFRHPVRNLDRLHQAVYYVIVFPTRTTIPYPLRLWCGLKTMRPEYTSDFSARRFNCDLS